MGYFLAFIATLGLTGIITWFTTKDGEVTALITFVAAMLLPFVFYFAACINEARGATDDLQARWGYTKVTVHGPGSTYFTGLNSDGQLCSGYFKTFEDKVAHTYNVVCHDIKRSSDG